MVVDTGPRPDGARTIGPHLFWHAAALEQLDPTTMLVDPDAAARALIGAARLHGVDLVPAAPLEAIGWAARSAAQPGVPLPVVAAQQRAGTPLAELPDPEAVAESAAFAHVVAIVERLVALAGPGVRVGVSIPTAAALEAHLGASHDAAALDGIVGAAIRAIGPAEPGMVLRIGGGDRGGMVPGVCSFFGLPLVEVTDDDPAIAAPHGDEFSALRGVRAALITTTTELPADADPSSVTAAVQALRDEQGGAS